MHVDSSGVFQCPVSPICKQADSGEVFDALLLACKSALSVLRNSKVDIDQVVAKELREAIRKAEGKA